MNKHIGELRTRVVRCLMMLGLSFAVCYYYSNTLYSFIAQPYLKNVTNGATLIATHITAPFMIPLQLSFLVALLFCAPFILYQTWMFIKPGLYTHERKNIAPFLLLSCLLFYAGIIFALYVICPTAIKFFASCTPSGVTLMLDLGNYLDFILSICLASAIVFQIPILTKVLIKIGVFSKQDLKQKRKHVIVLALIVGMILAPPDVISQLLLAIPMWGLFELGLIFC